MSSSTSTERDGALVAGFEIDSLLGVGPRGTVYVATQTGLGRRVALKLYLPLGDGTQGRPWPEHPGVARLYASGPAGDGRFTAAQLAPGGSLATRLAAGDLDPGDALALCDQVEATLAAIAVPHGALSAANVLIDAHGRALLCDFGPAGDAEADRHALAELRRECERLATGRSRGRGRHAAWWLAAVAAAGIVAVVALDGHEPRTAAPPLLPGTRALGSTLTSATTTTLGCDGRPPTGSTPSCTIVQVRRDGRALAVPADGVIRRWAVRGARGGMGLRIVRWNGAGRYAVAAGGPTERVADTGMHTFATDLAVRRGDLVALEVEPGAGMGVVPGARASTLRFMGPLRLEPARAAVETGGFDHAVELRVEYLPRGRPRSPPTLSGAPARDAPAGQPIAERDVELPGGHVRTIRVVRLRGAVGLDLLQGDRRLTRVTVVGAQRTGTLASFGATGPTIDVIWSNPDGREIPHRYMATATRIGELF